MKVKGYKNLFLWDAEDEQFYPASEDMVFEAIGVDRESVSDETVKTENCINPEEEARQQGFNEGYEHAKTEALIAIVKAVVEL